METLVEQALRFLVAWAPTWLGFTGWTFAAILVVHGSSNTMSEKGAIVVLTRDLLGCLLIALFIGVIITALAWSMSPPG